MNAAMLVRGCPGDYTAWVTSGAQGWHYATLLPYFRRSETAPARDPRVRGVDRPMRVVPQPADNPMLYDLFLAALCAGRSIPHDINDDQSDGVGWIDQNVHDGLRQTTADTYLRPILGRSNLTVLTDALVCRLWVERDRCTGVEYRITSAPGHEVRQASAAEVIVAAGAIGSPHLVMVSGIGPSQNLRDNGVEVVAHLPGVGENPYDHPLSGVDYSLSQRMSAELVDEPGHFLVRPQATATADRRNDVLLVGLTVPFHSTNSSGPERGFTVAAGLMQPASRGTVRLNGPDVATPPLVDPKYLGETIDCERFVRAIHLARDIGGQAALGDWRDEEVLPGPQARTDADSHLRRSTTPFYHHAGTCRMGSDPGAVVDPQLRVHGINGLRVVDSSIMPTPISANTNASVLAVAERAADLIRGGTANASQSC